MCITVFLLIGLAMLLHMGYLLKLLWSSFSCTAISLFVSPWLLLLHTFLLFFHLFDTKWTFVGVIPFNVISLFNNSTAIFKIFNSVILLLFCYMLFMNQSSFSLRVSEGGSLKKICDCLLSCESFLHPARFCLLAVVTKTPRMPFCVWLFDYTDNATKTQPAPLCVEQDTRLLDVMLLKSKWNKLSDLIWVSLIYIIFDWSGKVQVCVMTSVGPSSWPVGAQILMLWFSLGLCNCCKMRNFAQR